MPFPATSETCYVAPPTSAPTFPPTPSLSLAAFSRPFTSLLECVFPFTECFSQTPKPPGVLSPVPGPDTHSCPGFFCLFTLPHQSSLPLVELLPFALLLTLLMARILLALLWECCSQFPAGRVLGGRAEVGAEGRASSRQAVAPAWASLLAGVLGNR